MTPGGRIISDQILTMMVFAVLPALWWLGIDRVGCRDVLRPLPGRDRSARRMAVVLAIVYGLALRLTEAAGGQPLIAIPPAATWSGIALVALGASARAAVEEVLFRGYLLGGLRRGGLSFASANGLQALAFAGLHAPGWLFLSPYGTAQALGLIATTAVFALVAGVIVRLRGGIGTAVALHAAVNVASGAGWSGAWQGL